MEMMEVQKRADQLGIKTKNFNKANLIRKIQIVEGKHPCFQMKRSSCKQVDCCWRKDCYIKFDKKSFFLTFARNASTS